MRWILAIGLVFALGFLATVVFGVFVVQPIGAIPDGRTVITWRLKGFKFIDSADGWCLRNVGSVSLLCRARAMGMVAESDNILLRLPYSRRLYLWSTDGAEFER